MIMNITSRSRLHFIGIAGHAMRGIALAASGLGYNVSGSDDTAVPPGSDWLDDHGILWWREPAVDRLDGVDAIIISGGTKPDYAEIVWAQQSGVAIYSFAEFVGYLARHKRRIVIAGTHGKTTTSSLVAWLLESAGRKPDFLIGIQPRNFDSSIRLSRDSEIIVFEGDEYTASQLDRQPKFNYYRPDSLVLTTLEMDHPDVFHDLSEIVACFRGLVASMPADGLVSYWGGSSELVALMTGTPMVSTSYDTSGVADWASKDITFGTDGLEFTVVHVGQELGRVVVGLYGEHNVQNALGAISAVMAEGLSFRQVVAGCRTFLGAVRRFERVSTDGARITVIDDYAHHPTEVMATIAAAKKHFPDGRVIVVFRPHTYSRTSELLAEYQEAFAQADVAFVTDIEAAREGGQEELYNISGQDIVRGASGQVSYVPDRSRLADMVVEEARSGDLVLCMTVGSYEGLVTELDARLNKATTLE
jgi:UDP-N-acetylmuramate: L-alanyl-gamma-D-glutamyl-meso-diaminopimelate ligase